MAPLLLAGAAGFLLFWQLGGLPAQQWDEARTGVNALEMLLRDDWLVVRYLGEPDLWNSKPPLHFWALATSFRLLGPTELALRLPSALAALLTVGLVYVAGRRWLHSPAAGLLAGLILVTTGGFTTLHVARSGDFDALLTLCLTAGSLSWIDYLQSGRRRWAALTGLGYVLAILTKGVAALLPVPGLLLAAYALGALPRLRRPAPWLAVLGVVAVAGAWYGIREAAAPGYLQGVADNELGMAVEQLEGHNRPLWYYLKWLAEDKFYAWLAPAVLGAWLAWRPAASAPAGAAHLRGVACVAGSQLLVLSLTRSKLPWYDAPVYPLLALLAAAGVVWAARAVAAHYAWRPRPAVLVLLPLLCVAGPYADRLTRLRELHQRRWEQAPLLYGRHLRQQHEQLPTLTRYAVVDNGEFNDSPEFYRAAAAYAHGHEVAHFGPAEAGTLPPEQVVVACGAAARRPWEQRYQTEVLVRTDSCVTLRLLARR
ncbi:hypothetical protein GCM10027048_34420 [Hymenobacter coalescens]